MTRARRHRRGPGYASVALRVRWDSSTRHERERGARATSRCHMPRRWLRRRRSRDASPVFHRRCGESNRRARRARVPNPQRVERPPRPIRERKKPSRARAPRRSQARRCRRTPGAARRMAMISPCSRKLPRERGELGRGGASTRGAKECVRRDAGRVRERRSRRRRRWIAKAAHR